MLLQRRGGEEGEEGAREEHVAEEGDGTREVGSVNRAVCGSWFDRATSLNGGWTTFVQVFSFFEKCACTR
jgi:hypothetical protein